ncbi:Rieske 2Fe-2S domain-containing protein [Comamonas sp. JC664]|nr:Rieske 2Fe-2S domain-containing protein [Comamonas sp. JC664]GHG75363.1 (2Fe-2S)-binding protein [Comamonas sp. KCTC 72670]
MPESLTDRFPMSPYPIGWFRVAASEALRPGTHQNLRVFGQELVLFRTASGAPRLIEAYCPHLGTHLGKGGCVEGENMVCPLHAWRIGGDGSVVHVPYSKATPRIAVRSWLLREVSGQIFVWHHPDDVAPEWEPPVLFEATDSNWTGFLPARTWTLRTHVQEFCENGADNVHSTWLHGQQSVTKSVEVDRHVYTHRTAQRFTFFGLVKALAKEAEGTLDISCHGLGIVVERGQVTMKLTMEYCLVFFPLPVDDTCIELHSVLSIRRLPSELATRLLWKKSAAEMSAIIDQDVPVWESKRWKERPVLVAEDGPIHAYRSWARQFYPKTQAALRPGQTG